MTDSEKKAFVQALVGNDAEATDALIGVYLDVAKGAILNRLYYEIPTDATVPSRYEIVQCRLAAQYFLVRGAEGEISHSENGIARTYGSTTAEDILAEVLPIARVV